MEISAFLSPLVIVVVSAIALPASILAILDVRRSRQRAHRNRTIMKYITERTAKSFAIIVELDRSAEAILPLLDHLRGVPYSKLQAIVIVRHTAGKRALVDLRRYQRAARGQLAMSIIKHKKGMSYHFVLRRYTRADLVMRMEHHERVRSEFFTRVSLEFLDTSLDAATVRQLSLLDDTLASAARSWNLVLRDIWVSLMPSAIVPVVFRRVQLLKDDVSKVCYLPQSALATNPTTHLDPWAGFGALLLLTIVGLASYLVVPESWILTTLAVVASLSLILILHVTSFQYRLWDKWILIFFLPFWPLIATITVLTLAIPRRSISIKHNPKRRAASHSPSS